MPGRKDGFWGDGRSGGQELRNGRMWPSLSRKGRNPARQQQAGGCPGAGWLGPVDELHPAVVVGGILVELSEVPTGAMAGEGSPIPPPRPHGGMFPAPHERDTPAEVSEPLDPGLPARVQGKRGFREEAAGVR